MSDFTFMLTEEERDYLNDLVRLSIESQLSGEGPDTPPEPPTEKLKREHGAFVTLKLDGDLRGCIGHVQGDGPLYQTIWDMARAAAFRDPRFGPLTSEEWSRVETEISVLGPINFCRDPNAIEIGRHGLIVNRGEKSGLLLPQVAVEWGWTKDQFLRQVCQKAGLQPDAWNKVGTHVYWFEAVIF